MAGCLGELKSLVDSKSIMTQALGLVETAVTALMVVNQFIDADAQNVVGAHDRNCRRATLRDKMKTNPARQHPPHIISYSFGA